MVPLQYEALSYAWWDLVLNYPVRFNEGLVTETVAFAIHCFWTLAKDVWICAGSSFGHGSQPTQKDKSICVSHSKLTADAHSGLIHLLTSLSGNLDIPIVILIVRESEADIVLPIWAPDFVHIPEQDIPIPYFVLFAGSVHAFSNPTLNRS